MYELFETLTLVQANKIEEVPPMVLFGSEFWNDVCDFDALVKWVRFRQRMSIYTRL